MEFIVTNDRRGFNFNPLPAEEVIQNVRTIISTPIWSQPLDRMFGIDASFVDRPPRIAEQMYRAEIIDKIHRYEPRATVLEVISAERGENGAADGQFSCSVRININV